MRFSGWVTRTRRTPGEGLRDRDEDFGRTGVPGCKQQAVRSHNLEHRLKVTTGPAPRIKQADARSARVRVLANVMGSPEGG